MNRDTRSNWKIEYEIPPLRAIYECAADDCTEAEAREVVRTVHHHWRIRKVTEVKQ